MGLFNETEWERKINAGEIPSAWEGFLQGAKRGMERELRLFRNIGLGAAALGGTALLAGTVGPLVGSAISAVGSMLNAIPGNASLANPLYAARIGDRKLALQTALMKTNMTPQQLVGFIEFVRTHGPIVSEIARIQDAEKAQGEGGKAFDFFGDLFGGIAGAIQSALPIIAPAVGILAPEFLPLVVAGSAALNALAPGEPAPNYAEGGAGGTPGAGAGSPNNTALTSMRDPRGGMGLYYFRGPTLPAGVPGIMWYDRPGNGPTAPPADIESWRRGFQAIPAPKRQLIKWGNWLDYNLPRSLAMFADETTQAFYMMRDVGWTLGSMVGLSQLAKRYPNALQGMIDGLTRYGGKFVMAPLESALGHPNPTLDQDFDSDVDCDACKGGHSFWSSRKLQNGRFFKSGLVEARVTQDIGANVHGEVDYGMLPMRIKINGGQTPARAAIATAHEMAHVIDKLLKLKMTHEQVHHLGTIMASEVVPAIRGLETMLGEPVYG